MEEVKMGKWIFSKVVLVGCLAIFSLTEAFAHMQTATPKEALMLRRITEYWKDGDYETVKRQIADFLVKNPQTTLKDHLNAMLGDIYFQQHHFRQALATYDLITNPEIREKTFFNHLQALFETKDYQRVIEIADHFLNSKTTAAEKQIKVRYLLAEACFRQALSSKEMEKRVFYLKMAKPHYKILSQTPYGNRVLFPLAEIHRLLKENSRAATLYLNLAERFPKHRERFLFQAAILQITQNKEQALQSFLKVYQMGGKRSKLAAFNYLVLCYQTQNYDHFLRFYEKVIPLMPQQKLPLLQFYEGRCHYSMGDYQQAVQPLENFVTNTKGRSKELKTALLLLVNCSRYLKDITLLERSMYAYKTQFPKDHELAKIAMIHSQMCRENGDLHQALQDLTMISQEFPGYESSEAVMYDYALLLSQVEKWTEAKTKFLAFLEKYPQSERVHAAWRHLLNCSIEEMKTPSNSHCVAARESFIKILEKALEEENVLSDREKKQYQLVLIKCKCEMGQYEEVIPALTEYIADSINPEYLSEAHLLMAICQKNIHSDDSLFVYHGEKALSYNPQLPDFEILHLELFNAYLSKSLSQNQSDQRQYFIQKAAEHLFTSGSWKNQKIKKENFLWLTNHYYKLAEEGSEHDFARANLLFKELLGLRENDMPALHISSDSLYLEPEVLKFAKLLDIHQKNKEQIKVLEMLVQLQEKQNQLPWKFNRRAVLELAKAYEKDNQYQNALNSYQWLVNSSDHISSVVTSTAQLHLVKLEYQLLKPQKRTNESQEMIAILHRLKDLQIQKKLPAEPVHLEAALQYAEIRSRLGEPELYAKNAKFFYKRMQDDFHSHEDPITEEYNHVRTQNPEKNVIFGCYMKYLDAQILKCEAEMARKAKEIEKAIACENEALEILNDLLKNEKFLKPYLLSRVKQTKMELTEKL